MGGLGDRIHCTPWCLSSCYNRAAVYLSLRQRYFFYPVHMHILYFNTLDFLSSGYPFLGVSSYYVGP
jgi:hypothetical protein